jgi:hypothetical protein
MGFDWPACSADRAAIRSRPFAVNLSARRLNPALKRRSRTRDVRRRREDSPTWRINGSRRTTLDDLQRHQIHFDFTTRAVDGGT